MVTDRKLSQVTFDKIQHQLHEMKQKALSRNDQDGWGDADKLHWLLLELIEDQIVEGSIKPEQVSRQS